MEQKRKRKGGGEMKSEGHQYFVKCVFCGEAIPVPAEDFERAKAGGTIKYKCTKYKAEVTLGGWEPLSKEEKEAAPIWRA